MWLENKDNGGGVIEGRNNSLAWLRGFFFAVTLRGYTLYKMEHYLESADYNNISVIYWVVKGHRKFGLLITLTNIYYVMYLLYFIHSFLCKMLWLMPFYTSDSLRLHFHNLNKVLRCFEVEKLNIYKIIAIIFCN